MKLRFPESEIQQWAKRYKSGRREAYFTEIKPTIQEQGYLDKELLKRVARWKSPRRAGLIERNDDDYIKDLTSFAFSATSERARIEVLLLLDGVGWPTASVTLHLFHKDPYPILDFWHADAPIASEHRPLMPSTLGHLFFLSPSDSLQNLQCPQNVWRSR